MYLLVFMQNGEETVPALFESLDAGIRFVQAIPGYHVVEEVYDGTTFRYERFSPDALPVYMELECEGNKLPLSRYMFRDDDEVEILWREIPCIDRPGQGLVDGQTLVDAYAVDNHQVAHYISVREHKCTEISRLLDAMGYETVRSLRGSEDGEALLYRRRGSDGWSFLSHLDPVFVYDTPDEEGALHDWIREQLLS